MAENNKITLKEAVKFHGHLGPYLVLGILAGNAALNKLKCKKYFGIGVRVWGATEKPKSCLIDGLQLAAGSTYGKGNIGKINGAGIKIEVVDTKNKKKIILRLKDNLEQRLKKARTHSDSEVLARQLYRTPPAKLFKFSR